MTDAEHRPVGAGTAEIHLQFQGAFRCADLRAFHIQTQPRIEQVETATGTGIEVIAIRIVGMIFRIEEEETIDNLLTGSGIEVKVTTHLTIKTVRKILFLCA